MFKKTKTRMKLYAEKLLDVLNRSSWGAMAGSMAAAVISMLYFLGVVRTGLPAAVDMLLVLAFSLLVAVFTFGTVFYLYTVALKINRYIIIAVISSFLLIAFLPDEKFNRPFIFLELFSGLLVGIALNRNTGKLGRVLLLTLTVLINAVLFFFLFGRGPNHAVPVKEAYWKQPVITKGYIENPLNKNPYSVGHLFYGSGTDRNREEFGKDVAIKTESVNGRAFLAFGFGIKSFLRKSYWGFDVDKLPVNGRVWYPKKRGVYPLVLFVHGNHLMTEYSDAGYEYLGELLASQGFIVASIDENFFNESWFNDFWFSENNARAWLLLKHLEEWRRWNSTPGNPFYGQIDLSNICLAGHSRGADAVAISLVLNDMESYPFDGKERFNFGFSIKSVVQIAPAGHQVPGFELPLKRGGVNALILHGSHDQDVYFCEGLRAFNRMKIDSGQRNLKAMIYLYKANHGQFNTVWGVKDNRFPNQYFVNSATLLNGEDQRKIAGVYISAFLQATLLGKQQYISLLKDCRTGFDFLPRNYYISQYEDQSFRYISDFEEDQKLNTTSMPGCMIEAKGLKSWFEKMLPLRNGDVLGQENRGVFLEWEYAPGKGYPCYTIKIADSTAKKRLPYTMENLFFSVANNSDQIDRMDFSIEIKTSTTLVKKPLSSFYITSPLLKTELAKWDYLEDVKKTMPVERVLQFVQLPISAFKALDAQFDPSQIREIRFVFDRQPAGFIIIDRIGYN